MHLNHPKAISPIPSLWKNSLPRDQALVPKRLGTTAPDDSDNDEL